MTIRLQIGWQLKDLPNCNGFKFRGVLENGDLVDCKVILGDSGTFKVVTDDVHCEPIFRLLRGWMQHLPKKLVSEGFIYEKPTASGYSSHFIFERPTSPTLLNKREVFSISNWIIGSPKA